MAASLTAPSYPTAMLAPEHTVTDFTLPTVDVAALARRVAIPALLAGAAVAVVLLAGGRVHAFADGLRRGLDVSPSWALIGATLECASLAGYVALLALVAGRATPRIRARESAQIALAGAAATRLLPTAGVGGVALAIWTLRRAGLRARTAAGTLMAFMVVLYSVFLIGIVVSGSLLALGVVDRGAPRELGIVPAAAATLAIVVALAAAWRTRHAAREGVSAASGPARVQRLVTGVGFVGQAVRDAWALVRERDARLAGALAYWAFDAAVLWAMLRAVGIGAPLPVVALAYLIGQVANTVPIPGSVSGGMVGVLIACGVPAQLALPAVLGYRAIAIWLPLPIAIATLPGLRTTIARWGRDDATAAASAGGPRYLPA